MSAILLSCAAQAATHVALPPAQYVDTETTTNVSFMMGANGRHTFRFALSFAGTPSNNVEVALGLDANSDGILSAGETELVVGWDCGRWFLWNFAAGTRQWSETCGDGTHRLDWTAALDATNAVTRLAAVFDGGRPFASVTYPLPPWLHNPEWNIFRLTGRGTDELGEVFVLAPDGTTLRYR
ncbi:MAG: hypothetical protein IJU61_08265 [Victivallales bacterium]|nr:hypothetical protein [Victivallales bacterium]